MVGYKIGEIPFMKTLLALICFISTLLHGFFGYYLYQKGEGVFQPDGMVIAIEKKAPSGLASFDIFRSKSGHIQDPKLEDQAKNPAKYHAGVSEEAPAAADPAAPAAAPAETSPAAPAEAVKDEAKEAEGEAAAPAAAAEETKPQEKDAPGAEKAEYLPFTTGWIGFLQIENALVGLLVFLLGCAVLIVRGKGTASRWVFLLNLVFWGASSGLIYFFRPVNTQLEMIRIGVSVPQWYFIIGLCGLGALLSLVLLLTSFGRDRSKTETAPILPKEEPAAEKKSIFSLKKKEAVTDSDTPQANA
jgi:hypothetical protein